LRCHREKPQYPVVVRYDASPPPKIAIDNQNSVITLTLLAAALTASLRAL
jgi:hypothetical protein